MGLVKVATWDVAAALESQPQTRRPADAYKYPVPAPWAAVRVLIEDAQENIYVLYYPKKLNPTREGIT